MHYFTQLGPTTEYPCVIAERSSGLCHQCLHAQKIHSILYTLCYIAQASEVSALVLYVLQHLTYFICVMFILLLLPHGSKQGILFHYVQSPCTGNNMPVTYYVFIVLVHKLVTLNRWCSPLLGNHLCGVKPIPSTCDQHEMTTCQLGLSARYLHLMLNILHLMEVKSNLPRGTFICLNLVAMSLLVFNRRLQDSVGWPPWVWLRILSH